jgi:hypothetical protein
MNMKDFCNSGRAETPLAARKRGTCIMADEDQSGWEEVWKDQTQQPTERTLRMKVPGGWLYRHNYARRDGRQDSMVFVADNAAAAPPQPMKINPAALQRASRPY